MFRKRYEEYLTDKIATKIADRDSNRLSALVYEVKKSKNDVANFMKKEKSDINTHWCYIRQQIIDSKDRINEKINLSKTHNYINSCGLISIALYITANKIRKGVPQICTALRGFKKI